MPSYDPKLLEAFYRFMAEASRSQGQLRDFLGALGEAGSPEAWAELMKPFAPEADGGSWRQWSEAYWRALGLVPRSRYDELERRYLDLKERLEEAEREAARARRLLDVTGQEEKAREAVTAWSEALEQTLSAQRSWWAAWLGDSPKPDPE